MPVSVLSSAISEKLSQKKNEENFADQLAATTKRVLLTKIEYEEATAQTYANVFDKLKNKYTVLELQSNTEHNNGGNSSYLQQKSQEKLNSLATNDRNIKGKQRKQDPANFIIHKKKFSWERKKIKRNFCSTFSLCVLKIIHETPF